MGIEQLYSIYENRRRSLMGVLALLRLVEKIGLSRYPDADEDIKRFSKSGQILMGQGREFDEIREIIKRYTPRY